MLVIFTVILLGLLVLGLPVAFSLGTAGLFGMFAFMGGGSSLAQIPILAYKSLDDFVLTAVPLYILMSQILLTGKVGNDLFELGNKWLRHLPGGLGVATVFACAIFAAITGSSVACAVTIGAIAIPEMLSRGYERTLVLGAVAAGGTLGILIPPSIPMILYGAITGESVGQLFMSGVVPGVILTLLFIAVVVYSSRKLPLQEAASWEERFQALRSSFWGLLLPVLVVGGIYTGSCCYRYGLQFVYYFCYLPYAWSEGYAGNFAGYSQNDFDDFRDYDRRNFIWFRFNYSAGSAGFDEPGCRNGNQPVDSLYRN